MNKKAVSLLLKTAFIIVIFFTAWSSVLPEQKIEFNTPPEFSDVKFTGLPLPSYNDNDGFGMGVRGYLTRYDENFSPYKWQIWAQVYKTTKKRESHEFKADILNFLNSSLRVQIQGGYVRFQSAQYYGTGNFQNMERIEKIRNGEIPITENIPESRDIRQLDLDFIPALKEELSINEELGFNPGRRVLRERQNKYYTYDRIEPYLMFTTENWIGNTNLKWWTGVKTVSYKIDSYYGDKDDGEAETNTRTLLDIDKPVGYDAIEKAKNINLFRFALAYDSRPRLREKNPNSGIFSDIHFAVADKKSGSDYNFTKLTLTYRQYIELFPDYFHEQDEELVLGFRILGQETFGEAPFFELNRIYTKEIQEQSEGLGGTSGLRGYLSNQFVDRVMVMANTELRYTFSKKPWLGGMNWILITYFDGGRVGAERKEIDSDGWHKAWGGGIRLVWQANTIISITTGVSKFSKYTAFSFGHMF